MLDELDVEILLHRIELIHNAMVAFLLPYADQLYDSESGLSEIKNAAALSKQIYSEAVRAAREIEQQPKPSGDAE